MSRIAAAAQHPYRDRLEIVCLSLLLCRLSALAQTPAAPVPPATTASPSTAITTTSPIPDITTNPKYVAAITEAKQLSRDHQYLFAIDAYKKANKIAGGKDHDSLKKMFDLQIKIGEFKDAVNSATLLESIATTPVQKSRAESDRGQAILLETGKKNKLDKLQAAAAAFKAAIADNPKNGTARYLDGQVLARLNRMDAASEQFKQCLTCIKPDDPSYTRAEHFAENPELSTHKMAPPFTVTALDGTKFNLDEMGGRVVLIDFWATWCGPTMKSCRT